MAAAPTADPAAQAGLADGLRVGGLTPLTTIDFPGRLAAVVYCQGCPWRCGYCHNPALPAALAEARALGFATGLHTGGMYPDRLTAVLPLLDWVGLDIKGPPGCYDAITHTPGSGAKVWTALQRMLASGVAHECRTTWHAGLLGVSALHDLADTLATAGVRQWAVQECRTAGAVPWQQTPPVGPWPLPTVVRTA